MPEAWLVGAVVAFFVLRDILRDRGGPIPYRGRSCMGRAWRRAFPQAPKEQIRTFLECLVGGMGIASKAMLKFHPNDQVLDIYRALYDGRTPRSDQMECEAFLEDVAAAFRRNEAELLRAWHSQVTLGELFAVASCSGMHTPHAA